MSSIRNCRVDALTVRLAAIGLLALGAAPAMAQLAIGFEPPDFQGSADGVSVTGQQGWYLPNVAGAVDEFVFTYDGNALGLPANPFGETQFVGAQTLRLNDFPRAQLNFDFSTATVWTVSYDVAAGFNGTVAFDNLSSFSLQDSVTQRYFIAVNTWVNTLQPTQWNAGYIAFDASGVPVDAPGLSPGPAWRNLAVNHWYNQSTTFDFDSNTILSVSITDLETGDTSTYEPTGWYLNGGAVIRPPLPTGVRFFVGGGDNGDGNVGAWDNLTIDAVSGGSALNTSDSQVVQRVQLKGPATN